MRFPRLLIAALALAAALTACSGDDSTNDAPEGDAASQATGGESRAPLEERGCRATVEVTGAVEASWEGKATVRGEESGPSAVYATAQRKRTVTAYAAGEEFPSSVNFTDGDRVFATTPGDNTGLDLDPTGKQASIDVQAVNVEGQSVRVTATFDCSSTPDKDKKKKKKNKG